jgi:quercetin dioxygenase-like cupin family protein
MEKVLSAEDFAAARAVSSAKLGELGFVPICMAPGDQSPGHSHTLVEEIVVVNKGMGQIQIEDQTYDLCAGSVAIVPAGQFHALCNPGSVNLEGVTIFNRNIDRKDVVLKTREQHFADKNTKKKPSKDTLRKEI